MSKIYVALNANVFVKEIKEEIKQGVMIVPDSLDIDYVFGEVISCAEGYWDKGSYIPACVAPGDIIAFPKIAGSKINFNGEKLIKVALSDITAKQVEGEIKKETK